MQYRPADGVTAEPSGDRLVVLDPAGEVVTTISPVGALVWGWLPATPTDLEGLLSEAFPEVAPARLSQDVDEFLAQLSEAGLVVTSDAAR